ncbi:MAG: HIT family protein [Flavobacteriales bacterium]|jgi:histidine triad (HIT) family protein
MATIFSKIISGEIPCYKIAENDQFLAFLDILPVAKGHCLVIPKKEVDYYFDLDDQMMSDIHVFAKEVAKKIKKVVPCIKVGVAVVGLEVPHAHIHLIPMNSIGDLNFQKERIKMTQEEFAQLSEEIKNA